MTAGGTAGYYYYVNKQKGSLYEFALVKHGAFTQEISASGKVEPPTKINLRFKNSGKLTVLNVKTGEIVAVRQLLAKQNTDALDARISETKAIINARKAKLNQLLQGASHEDIAISETKISNAEISIANTKQTLEDAEKNLENIKNKADIDLNNLYEDVKDILNDAYIKADDAINKRTDDMFDNDISLNPQLSFASMNSQAKTDSEWKRVIAGNELKTFKTELDSLNSDYLNLDNTTEKAKNHLAEIEDFLIGLNEAVHGALGISQTVIGNYKTNILTGRENINTAVSSINNQKQLIASQKITNQKNIDSAKKDVNSALNDLKTAEGNLKTARDELALKKAPARNPDIALYEAEIKQAEAQMLKIEAEKQEMIISSPAAAIITETKGEVGETINPDTIVISLMPLGNLEIKVNIFEADVINVNVHSEARITLDAFSDGTEWKGKVVSLDPAETIIGGAVYYKAAILFDKEDERIKPGMTANVWIKTIEKKDALFIPFKALKEKSGKKYVEVLEENKIKEKEIQTGIKGENEMIEIISGLNEDEQIILSIKNSE